MENKREVVPFAIYGDCKRKAPARKRGDTGKADSDNIPTWYRQI